MREGCTQIVLELQRLGSDACDPSSSNSSAALPVSDQMVKAWLACLLDPSAVVPDGAIAHISMGHLHVTAEYHAAGEGSSTEEGWALRPRLPPALQLQLEHVDLPVLRLPPRAQASTCARCCGAASSEAGQRGSTQRVQLLLHSGAPLRVIGSDAVSATHVAPRTAAAEGQAEGAAVLQVIARGAWGACLAVDVVGQEVVEEAEGQDTSEQAGCLTAVSVSGHWGWAGGQQVGYLIGWSAECTDACRL